MDVGRRDPITGRTTTGHEWNGIEELNTPVPKVVLFFLAAGALFCLGYWLMMPAWPVGSTYTKGLLEFAAGHVPGAVNLPMSTIGEHIDELPDGAFDVICQIGGRSARAVQALEARGYDATNVDSGTADWAAAGYPVEV